MRKGLLNTSQLLFGPRDSTLVPVCDELFEQREEVRLPPRPPVDPPPALLIRRVVPVDVQVGVGLFVFEVRGVTHNV